MAIRTVVEDACHAKVMIVVEGGDGMGSTINISIARYGIAGSMSNFILNGQDIGHYSEQEGEWVPPSPFGRLAYAAGL